MCRYQWAVVFVSSIALSTILLLLIYRDLSTPEPKPVTPIVPLQIAINCEGKDDTQRLQEGLGITGTLGIRVVISGDCILRKGINLSNNYDVTLAPGASIHTPLTLPETSTGVSFIIPIQNSIPIASFPAEQ